MDRNAEIKWYMDQFSGSRERFYEIHMQMCRKFGISWSKATSKERQFIEEITRFTFEREQALFAESKIQRLAGSKEAALSGDELLDRWSVHAFSSLAGISFRYICARRPSPISTGTG